MYTNIFTFKNVAHQTGFIIRKTAFFTNSLVNEMFFSAIFAVKLKNNEKTVYSLLKCYAIKTEV